MQGKGRCTVSTGDETCDALASVVSPSATLSSAAQPLHAILVLSSTSTLARRPTSEMSAGLHFTIFTTSAGSTMSLISKQPQQSSRPSSFPVSTIVTHCCMGCHLHSSTGCSGCKMRQLEWWPGRVVRSTSHWCFSGSTDFLCSTASPSKILLLTYHALHGLTPSYLTALLAPYRPYRALRSGQQHRLHLPQTRLLTFGDRSFCLCCSKAMEQPTVQNPGRS